MNSFPTTPHANPSFLVTGATGKTGGAVVEQLIALGYPVRALVRSRDHRSRRLDKLGAETVVADLLDPDQLLDAMQGIQRAYYCPPFSAFMLQSATAFAVAAREAKLESIVQMGQWLSNPVHPALGTRQTWLIDQMLSMVPGVAHTIINPGMFADNFLRVIDFASLLGIFPFVTGRSRSAPVSNEDMARVIVAALLDPARHAGKTYRPTGPELLSGYEMASIVGRVLGHRVVPFELPFWMFLRVARMQKVDPFLLSGFRYYVQDHKQGAFEFEGGTNDVVEKLTGSPAESFETTSRRYAGLPFARKTWANRVRAFVNFNLVPFSPGYNLDRYEREHGFPVPPNPSLSIDDARWRRDHAMTRQFFLDEESESNAIPTELAPAVS